MCELMIKSLRMRLADNVKRYREEKGWSREELSLLLNVDNSYISKLERGCINITLDKLEQLASVLEVDAIQLIAHIV